jgi:sulfur carrier protein
VTRREADDDGERSDGDGDGDGDVESGVEGEREDDGVEVEVTVVGEEPRTVHLPTDATYGDVVRAVGLRTGEATALVAGSPVPEDRPVDADAGPVRVLRLIRGG